MATTTRCSHTAQELTAIKDVRDAVVNSDQLLTTIEELKARWACEKKYEDFADYQTAIAAAFAKVAPQLRVVKTTKQFRTTWAMHGVTFVTFMKSTRTTVCLRTEFVSY